MILQRKREKILKEEDDRKGNFRVRQKESSFDESKERNIQEVKGNTTAQSHQGTVDNPSEDSGSQHNVVFWVLVGLSQAIGINLITLVVYWCNLYGGFAWNSNAELQFFVHPLMMVLGLIFFFGEAILIYRVLYFLPKWLLKILHGLLHITAIIMSSVGLAAVFENHRRTNKADMYSLHSWVGIATFGAFCLQYIIGFVSFVAPGLPVPMRAKVMPYHTFFGLGIFILAVATALMGITERLLWTNNYSSGAKAGTIGNLLGLFLVAFAFFVVYISTLSKYKRRPLPTDAVAPINVYKH